MDHFENHFSSEDELKAYCMVAPFSVAAISSMQDTYFANEAWKTLFGQKQSVSAGVDYTSFIHPADLQKHERLVNESCNHTKGLKVKCRIKVDANYSWFIVYATPVSLPDADFSGCVLYYINIDDLWAGDNDTGLPYNQDDFSREQALNEELAASNEEIAATNEELTSSNEELQKTQDHLAELNKNLEKIVAERTRSLEESQHRTKAIIETAPFPIGVYTGREMRIQFANKAITDVWGKGRNVIGKLYSEVLPELANQSIFSQLDAVYITGTPFHAKNQRVDLLVENKLQSFYFNYSFTPMRDKDGAIYGVMNTAADVTDIVQAKIAVEKIQQELYHMILQAPVAMCILSGPNHVVTVANDLMIELWGKPAAQVMNKPVFEGLPDARSQGLEELLAKVYKTGIQYRAHEQAVSLVRHGKQEIVYQNFVYEAYRDASGNITGVIAATVDVTEQVLSRQLLEKSYQDQQETSEELAASNEELAAINEELTVINEDLTQAQESLFRSERLFRSIALNIPDSLILVIDQEQRFIAVEGDLMKKMGYNSTDFIGKHPLEATSPERYEASRDLYERVLAGERFSVERKSQTGEDFIVHLVPLKDENGEVYAGLMIALDISKIKTAEVESAKLAAIVHSSHDAILSKTLDGYITSWNKSAERIFGYTEKEMIGSSILKLIPEERLNEEPEIISKIKRGEQVEQFETLRRRKDGSLIDVALTISPVKDPSGQIIGVSNISRDISEKKLEEVRKNDFIGMVSHELKTPLTSLTALVQVLQLKLKTNNDPFLISATEKANIQVRKMASMINGFLNVSRLESGQLVLEKNMFSLQPLIEEIIDETSLTAPDREIIFLPGEDVVIHADRNKVSSVISNLIGNAIKYSERDTKISICSIVEKSEVRVSVKDEGIGIGKEDIGRLFERYYRVKTDSTRHVSGFGIGLYLSSEIVKRHGGRIWAESAGKGSTFHFTIPIGNEIS